MPGKGVIGLSNFFYLEFFLPVAYTRRTMDDLIEEILAELPDPVPEGQQFTDLDDKAPPSVRLPADQWVEILNDAKDEFEVDDASAVFSTWRVEEDDLLDIGDIEIAERAFGENHAASIMAKVKNAWKPTPASLLQDIRKACVEVGCGTRWTTTRGSSSASI